MLARTVTHRFTGEQVTFLETAEDTGGQYLLIEVSLPPHSDGPPLHSHLSFTEQFTVISGMLTVRVEKSRKQLSAGQQALLVPGIKHTFTNDHDEPVTFQVQLTPPSQFEQSMRIHYGLMDDDRTNAKGVPKNLFHLALILSLQDTLVTGIPPRLQRMFLNALVWLGNKTKAFAGLENYTGK
ncbi:cupin domain-containing protein [Jonesiaceae bacterium BS-20]|uniref:Cupin domain-containing protein n=1 Tax=Jonesiaceae bacterium BS-20 TaxID=3120821 RepID=A0AAU7DU15_9MICO